MKEEEVQREEEEDGLNFWEKYIEMQVEGTGIYVWVGELNVCQ